MASLEPNTREHAQRVADALNEFVGALHGARCTGVLWAKQAENPDYRIAAKYGVQGAFAITMLTLRKFGDLWQHHLCFLLPATMTGRDHCEQIIAECRAHNVRKTANLLIAHYAPRRGDLPLRPGEIEDLIRSNGWDTEEEVLHWVGELIPKILTIMQELKNCYGIQHLRSEEVRP